MTREESNQIAAIAGKVELILESLARVEQLAKTLAVQEEKLSTCRRDLDCLWNWQRYIIGVLVALALAGAGTMIAHVMGG